MKIKKRRPRLIAGRRKAICRGVRVIVKNLQKRLPVNGGEISRLVRKVCLWKGLKKNTQITVCFVDDRAIKGLNLRYLGKSTPTDVLVFNLSNSFAPRDAFYEIVISAQRAIYNAGIFRTGPLFELKLYAVHGLLHICGYNDKGRAEERVMDGQARAILSRLNICAPS